MAVTTGNAPWASHNRRTVRAEVNPLDKSTVVSIYPVEIDEKKPTIFPGRFIIPAGTYDKPSLLLVGPSSWWRELSAEEPLLEIPQSSILIAASIVTDYANGLQECNMNDIMPGIFFVPGEINVKELQAVPKYKNLLDKAKANQDRWWNALVKNADVLWARTNGNPLAISDDARIAARNLKLDKPWEKDFIAQALVPCKACGTRNNASIVVCPNCKVVLDAVKFKELGLSFA
jgi:hypothetical protein